MTRHVCPFCKSEHAIVNKVQEGEVNIWTGDCPDCGEHEETHINEMAFMARERYVAFDARWPKVTS